MREEKFSFFDWIGFAIGIIVIAFILLIIFWPLIDPTPNRSAPLKENLERLTEKLKKQ
tara:strand:- start:104 stop:277 length:174 start_codon:yes stop_codon:yes gene_type:complete